MRFTQLVIGKFISRWDSKLNACSTCALIRVANITCELIFCFIRHVNSDNSKYKFYCFVWLWSDTPSFFSLILWSKLMCFSIISILFVSFAYLTSFVAFQRLFSAKYVLDCTILVPVSVSIIIYPRRISLRLSCSSMHCLFFNAVLILHFVFWKGLARELIRLKDSNLVSGSNNSFAFFK